MIQRAKELNNCAAARAFDVTEKTVRDWRNIEDATKKNAREIFLYLSYKTSDFGFVLTIVLYAEITLYYDSTRPYSFLRKPDGI